VCRFVELTGGMAAIGSLDDAVDILAGKSGTIVTPNGRYDATPETGPRTRPLRVTAS
jgi:carbamate kinase